MRPYPDYGTPGSPNLDPYYVSPSDEVAQEQARRVAIEEIVADAQADIHNILEDAERLLKAQYAGLVSVTVDVGNLGVTIEAKS